MESVVAEWRSRISVEYVSAALTQHFVLWLMQAGAPPDLIEDGLAVVRDELEHSRLSHAVYAAAGGGGPPALDPGRLALVRRCARLEDDVVDACVQLFCLGETVAVPLFRHLRERCTVPVAREALDRILRDEVRHRDFGWDALDWSIAAQGDAVTTRLARGLPAMLEGLYATYGRPGGVGRCDDAFDAFDETERSWGLAPAREYAEIVARAVRTDVAARFAARGVAIAP